MDSIREPLRDHDLGPVRDKPSILAAMFQVCYYLLLELLAVFPFRNVLKRTLVVQFINLFLLLFLLLVPYDVILVFGYVAVFEKSE